MTLGAVIVTGAGGELGSAIARRLAGEGYVVELIDVVEEDLQSVTASIEEAGGRARPSMLDVSDAVAVEDFYRGFDSTGLVLSGLVNNAAIYPATPFLDVTVAEYDRVVAVNQRGYFLMAREAVRRMAAGAAILNITSITTSGGWANLSTYVQTKSAAIGLTRALARELGPRGIRVNGLSPGAIPTRAERIIEDRAAYNAEVLERQSLKRRGTAEDVADVASFLLGDGSSFVTGQNIGVDGGWMMS